MTQLFFTHNSEPLSLRLLVLGSAWIMMDQRNGEYAPIRNSEDDQLGKFDKPLPCFGCGIGWFFLLLGFACPLLWYYPTFLYVSNYYHKDPRERAGLAASAIAALIFTIAALITLAVFVSTTVSAHLSLIN